MLWLAVLAALQAPEAAPPPEEGLLRKGSFPGSYLLPGTSVSVKVGGYFKIDVIHDFDAIGSEDFFDPRTIPTDGSEGENTQVHARQTRLNFDVRTPTDLGDARFFLEGDFFGDGNSFRIRHAFVKLGNLLAGQTWSTFMDEDVHPPTLDYSEAIAFAKVRVAQVRWTQPIGEDFYAAFGVEAPDSTLAAMPVPGDEEDPYPDLTSRIRWIHGLGHLQASFWGGYARFRPDAGGKDDALLWGSMLAGSLKFLGKDQFLFQAGYGHGLGRYRAGFVAGPDENGRLDAIPVSAVMASYEHFWVESLSSNVCYSIAHASDTGGLPADTPRNLHYAAVNLIWYFLPWASVGVEYLYGAREDLDGSRGHANRVMISFKFDLP